MSAEFQPSKCQGGRPAAAPVPLSTPRPREEWSGDPAPTPSEGYKVLRARSATEQETPFREDPLGFAVTSTNQLVILGSGLGAAITVQLGSFCLSFGSCRGCGRNDRDLPGWPKGQILSNTKEAAVARRTTVAKESEGPRSSPSPALTYQRCPLELIPLAPMFICLNESLR